MAPRRLVLRTDANDELSQNGGKHQPVAEGGAGRGGRLSLIDTCDVQLNAGLVVPGPNRVAAYTVPCGNHSTVAVAEINNKPLFWKQFDKHTRGSLFDVSR